MVQFHRDTEQKITAFFADAMTEVHQVARITRRTPLETRLPTEILVIGITHPLGDHGLIAQVVEAFEQEQAHH